MRPKARRGRAESESVNVASVDHTRNEARVTSKVGELQITPSAVRTAARGVLSLISKQNETTATICTYSPAGVVSGGPIPTGTGYRAGRMSVRVHVKVHEHPFFFDASQGVSSDK